MSAEEAGQGPDQRSAPRRPAIEVARQVADAVLYEGYVLYPYRASSQKNRMRWQWGVLVPPAYAEAATEPWSSQTECLLEPGAQARLTLSVRFLQAQQRQVEEAAGEGFRPVDSLEVDGPEGGEMLTTWDEGFEHEMSAEFSLAALLEGPREVLIQLPHDRQVETVTGGRIVRERWPIAGTVHLSAERLEGPYGLLKLRVRTENDSSWAGATRDEALRHSLLAAHTILAVDDARFVSLLEHPEWAAGAVAGCENLGTFPVLVGPAGSTNVMLASPIILYDYPEIAPESAGELFDGTEIDEILTLRTMALTDQEKREARGTDPRAAALIDRVDAMPQEILDRLHGSIRYLRDMTGPPQPEPWAEPGAQPEQVPWWDPGADTSVSPGTDRIQVGTTSVGKGSRVRLRPGLRRTDAQDMFLTGRMAEVEAVMLDVDDNHYLAVTLTDDPAVDLQRWHGRYLYFHPDEVEPA